MLKALAAGIVVASALAPQAPTQQALTEQKCTVSDAVITWGFKESFRSYISGSIAQGEWLVEGDVTYETPHFRFEQGTGSISPDRSQGNIRYEGSFIFTGHAGILETQLSNPFLSLTSDSTATLFLDVLGDTMDELSVARDGVAFATVSWSDESVDPEAGTLLIKDASVVLTEDGSSAFGTYPEGESLDPMGIALTVTPGCLVRAQQPWALVLGALGLGALVSVMGLVFTRVRKSREQGRQ
ncbi:HtaA domain-containing protein [Pontimonas sp.]|nr:HtaA domain-containing protein [Pontimonas sp.]